jgi:hypothetical protein
VLGDLEQIYETQKARFASQLWSDIWKTNGLYGIDFDLTFFHSITGADFDVGTHPDSDAASDFTAANSLAKTLGEDHDASLHPIFGAVY